LLDSLHLEMSDDEISPRELLDKNQRNEKKELQSKIQALKKSVPKGDKKKKKEISESIAQLEKELQSKHQKELEDFETENSEQTSLDPVSSSLSEVHINDDEDEETPLGPLPIKHESIKMSKAQKRRDKKSAKERDRIQEIERQEEQNKIGPRAIEQQSIRTKLDNKNFKIKEIPSDGDCLFAGVVHQLGQLSITSSVQKLRQQTADELETNVEQYAPFLSNPETGDMLSDSEFKEYCHKMKTTAMWGSQVELKALSIVLKMPITVIQGEGADMTVGEEFSTEPLILTYHRHLHALGEHYNSVIPK